jgi:hypothetical protein
MAYIGRTPTGSILTSADIADGSISTDKIQDNAVTAAKYVEAPSFRNLIINGDMSIAQRGTSFSGMTIGQYTIDRWKSSTSGANLTMAQQSFTGTDIDNFNSKNYLKFTVNTANNNCGFLQYVEDAKRFLGKTVTLSFKAKGTNPAGGIIETAIACYTGSGGSYTTENRQQYSVTSNWQTFSFTTTVQSASGLTINDADSYMYVYPVIQPSADTSTASWEVDVAEVQIEYGSTSSDFEVIPYDVNLQRCYRYYEKDTSVYRLFLNNNNDFGSRQGHLQWKATKRATPSLTANPDAGVMNLSDRTIYGCPLKLGGAVSSNSHLPSGYIADSEL